MIDYPQIERLVKAAENLGEGVLKHGTAMQQLTTTIFPRLIQQLDALEELQKKMMEEDS